MPSRHPIRDFMSLFQLVKYTYRLWKKMCGRYTDIIRDLERLGKILLQLAIEVTVPNLLLLHCDKDLCQLKVVMQDCRNVVIQLKLVVSKGSGATSFEIIRQQYWNGSRLRNEALSDLRNRLTLKSLRTYLDTLGFGFSALDGEITHERLSKMKGVIDLLAANVQAGRKEDSIPTIHRGDKKKLWRYVREKLMAEGFSSDHLATATSDLRRYIQRLAEEGLLERDGEDESSQNSFPLEDKEQKPTTLKKTTLKNNTRVPIDWTPNTHNNPNFGISLRESNSLQIYTDTRSDFQVEADQSSYYKQSDAVSTIGDRFKVLLEHLLGRSMLWWPLKEPLRPLVSGMRRYYWKCVS